MTSGKDDIAALKEQIAKLTDLAARAQADLQNFKARQQRNAEELARFAIVPLLIPLLPIRDDLARAASHHPDDEGYTQILGKVDALFEEVGLKKMNALGQSVDPARHEVISTGSGAKDVIIGVHEEGYELHEKVLKPAKVIVGDGGTGDLAHA